jgi:predicted amidohydrolase
MYINPDYSHLKNLVRICSAQYCLTPVKSWKEITQKVSYFVDLAAKNQAQFLLMPEYFTIQFFNSMPEDWSEKQKLSALADQYRHYLYLFVMLSKQYQMYIIGGSHPVMGEDGQVRNIAHLFSPSGRVYKQEKLHITPNERQLWDYFPGNGIRLFDTPFGRIGIQICYDIEFPEVSRLMALNGADIIFVPFYTTDLYGYQRVRYAGQARAVENYLFTVLSGSVGDEPVISNLISYSQSAIFTPSDLGFPLTSIAAEADPIIETLVVADLNLNHLRQMRVNGL